MTDTKPSALKELIADEFDLSEPMTLEDKARLLRHCADLQADLAIVRGGLEHLIAEDMETDRVETSSGVLLRKYKPIAPKWDGRRLAYRVIRDVPACDPETGETLDHERFAAAITEELLACSSMENASHSWRKGALTSRGIEYRTYCETDGWKTTVGWE